MHQLTQVREPMPATQLQKLEEKEKIHRDGICGNLVQTNTQEELHTTPINK